MSHDSILNQKKFWEVLKYLSKLEVKTSWKEACAELGLTSKQLNSFLVFLREVNYIFEVEFETSGSEGFLTPPSSRPKIDMQFSLIEWLEFQAHFPYLENCKDAPFHEDIEMKLEEFENEYQSFDLFSPLDVFEHSQQTLFDVSNSQKVNENMILAEVERAVIGEECLRLEYKHNSEARVLRAFPRKIVYLEEHLCLICENTSDHTLMQIQISALSSASKEDKKWNPLFSRLEVDDFVSSMRKMAEFSTRLILKIKSYEKFQLNLGHQFFENPCVFTNGEGDIIWAATIEPNIKIFQWLESLGAEVEILESSHFKRKYLNYCENKLKKLA